MTTNYFTLSAHQGGPGCVAITAADWDACRSLMFKVWGERWAFQYESLEEVHHLDRRIIASYTDEEETSDEEE